MTAPISIFLDFNLPNATTWFYFSFLLAMALFFKFSRIFSIRNLDVITIFGLVPGILLIQGANLQPSRQYALKPIDVARMTANTGTQLLSSPVAGAEGIPPLLPVPNYHDRTPRILWVGYLWLLCGSIYLIFRCLLDLVLVRRPALAPNLNYGGLAWLAGALFICLGAVAFRPTDNTPNPMGDSEQNLLNKNGKPEVIGKVPAMQNLAQNQLRPSFFLRRSFAIACHLSIIIGLIIMGWRHFQDLLGGVAAATFYLLLPYTGYFVGQIHHVWPMAFLIWAFVAYRHPAVAGLFLGIAAGTAYFPALLLPLWISFYWKRGAWSFMRSFLLVAGVCLATTAIFLWLNNSLSPIIRETLALSDWQPWTWQQPKQEGFWMGLHWAYRMPVFIIYLTFVLVTAIWPSQKNLAQTISLSAAILIGIQLWYSDQGGVYVLWYLPLVLLMIFRPNLSERRPALVEPKSNNKALQIHTPVKGILAWFFRSPDHPVRSKAG